MLGGSDETSYQGQKDILIDISFVEKWEHQGKMCS
jgi:hypothetical protein